MRPIKFRCFIKSKNTMFPVFSIVNMNNEIGIRVFPDKPVIEGEQLNYLTSDGDIELMQFTGLLDKNGVDIFEGDIFDSLYKFDGCAGKYVINWNESNSSFYPKLIGDHQQKKVSIFMRDMTRLEVIGNIYQNPELLTN